MQKIRQIAIILSDTLRSTGLQSLLIDYFSPVEVCYYPTFTLFTEEGRDQFDTYFTDAATFIVNTDFFLPRKMKTAVVLPDGSMQTSDSNSILYISPDQPQEMIVEQLRQLFRTESDIHSITENNRDLSSREIDVLQLIVKGNTNKEIGEKLSISLNTVLTHRKNITAKLGIKTVSGLTYFAIMNGYLSADDIEL